MARNVSTVEEFMIVRGQNSYPFGPTPHGLRLEGGHTEKLAVSTIAREYLASRWTEVTDGYKGFTVDNPKGRAFATNDYVVFIIPGNKYAR